MDNVDKFLERTQTDDLTLTGIALEVWREKLKLEYVQTFGECTVKELELMHRYLRDGIGRKFDMLVEPMPPEEVPDCPITTMPIDYSKKPKKKKKKRGKKL